MGKLIAPNGAEIIGTYEMIPGCAGILGVSRNESGGLEIEHDGDTDVWWNEQRTETESGQRIFVAADNVLWLEGHLTLVETEDDEA